MPHAGGVPDHGPSSSDEPSSGSPAAAATLGCGVAAVVLSLSAGAASLSLFLALAALAALPMALADKAGRRATKQAVTGTACAVLALVLVGNALLFSDAQRERRRAAGAAVELQV